MGTHGDPWDPRDIQWTTQGIFHGPTGRLGGWSGNDKKLAGWAIYQPPWANNCRKTENRKIKKPYIKVVRDSCLWDSGTWDRWERILDSSTLFFVTSDLTKPQKHYMFGIGAHDIFWEWRTRYFLGVAHTVFFGSGAHEICMPFVKGED